MLRKALFGVFALVLGYGIGLLVGFGKGINYHQDKTESSKTDDIFEEPKTAHINLSLDSKQ